MMHVRITRDALDAADLLARVGGREDGAVLLFQGTVRDHNGGLPVSGIHYDAYVPMAEEVLRAIAGEALERLREAGEFADAEQVPGRIAVEHRIGELAIGDASVAIAVATPHRAEAFDASRYIIEQIKLRLPVWKEERYAAGDARWLDGARPPVPEAAHE